MVFLQSWKLLKFCITGQTPTIFKHYECVMYIERVTNGCKSLELLYHDVTICMCYNYFNDWSWTFTEVGKILLICKISIWLVIFRLQDYQSDWSVKFCQLPWMSQDKSLKDTRSRALIVVSCNNWPNGPAKCVSQHTTRTQEESQNQGFYTQNYTCSDRMF